ncbi:hypothetical protein MJO28_011748 [Puccinia striiformis f. sp. tritici]|uniref:Uncharacterized protein n=1 Tax=Puccinia striiformis f. sp. tritici TaxID=168172 RepID=A0ACC0E304_9BASI|nr:hypothetical protein Pst134EB_022207 [Puccinia striiformis f. sp. tritici]KAI7944220.1 hypothetical protein MJO28_011748 [Puccinia striiformis f. sp. tritici]KAI9614641.1 hypothetical protein H4Q26_009024 [Puccinia striiformis f. sp. tritici PST-130]
MNFHSVILLIYTISIDLRFINTRAITPRGFLNSSSPESLSPGYEREGDMIISRLNPTNTITVKLSKDSTGFLSDMIHLLRINQQFEAKFFLLSSGNTSTIPVGDQVNNTVPIPPVLASLSRELEIPTITNAEIKRLTGPSNGQEDTNRNDPYGVSAARGSGRNYFLITLVAQNNPDDTTGLPTNFTVLVITQPISSAAMLRFNPIWVLITIILLLAGMSAIALSHYDYNMGGDRGRRGNRDKEKMMVDLITPFRPQDYYSTNKIHTEWNGITRAAGRGFKSFDLARPKEIGHLDDIDKFSLKDFKICQAKKLVNFHHHPSGNQPSLAGQHDHDKEDQPNIFSPVSSPTSTTTPGMTSSYTTNNLMSPVLSTLTSPTSFQSLAFSDYHHSPPFPSLPKKCITTP